MAGARTGVLRELDGSMSTVTVLLVWYSPADYRDTTVIAPQP